MTFRDFIKENRKVIDAYVKEQSGVVLTNDNDRREWILNDEPLYRWAREHGVRI
jgi:hypothetical protein